MVILPDLMSPKSLPAKISSVLVPRLEIFCSTRCCDPCPSATTLMTEAMPMMMPSMVRKVRSLCARIDRSAMRNASRSEETTPARPEDPPETAAGLTSACATGVASALRSEMMAPSLISMIRPARLAIDMSWVTMMTVRPSACSSSRIRRTSSPLALSSAPVGSSARMTSASFIKARAMETRCCWPPESWPGR
ncbi:hypothetical protein D3C87_1155740 [compost metagenome]